MFIQENTSTLTPFMMESDQTSKFKILRFLKTKLHQYRKSSQSSLLKTLGLTHYIEMNL